MKTVTSFQTLMKYAFEMSKARRSKDKKLFTTATERHVKYKNLCLKSNYMIIGRKKSDL